MNIEHWLKVELRFTLTVLSNLHIGDGDVEAMALRINAELVRRYGPNDSKRGDGKENDALQGKFASVIRDHVGKPYIPGSALRGWLRQAFKESPLQRRMFGANDAADGSANPGFDAGALRVCDCYLERAVTDDGHQLPYFDAARGTAIAHGVAIDAVTGTAADKKLFQYEYVPVGTRFAGKIVWLPTQFEQCISRLQLKELSAALDDCMGGAALVLGAKVSAGMGRIKFGDVSAFGVNLADLPTSTPISDQPIACLEFAAKHTIPPPNALALQLVFDAPFLINEAARRPPGGRPDDQPKANQNFQRDENGNAKIPGTSLRGLARGHAEKILRTKLVALGETIDDANKIVKQESAKLFGTERQRSLLFFTDAIAATTQPHAQTFNAIDRFTGGVAHGKLFSAQAVAPCTATFTVRATAALADWQKGWLLWLARDAAEGMLSIGWGKGKGFGAFLLRESSAEHKFQSRWWAPGQAWLQAFDDEVVKLSLKPDQINTSFGVSHE